jgi:sugar phosphate isomerase/epimerase
MNRSGLSAAKSEAIDNGPRRGEPDRVDVAASQMVEPRRRAHAAGRKQTAPQYSLAHLTVLGCPPPEMTYIAARAGYDFVSLRIIQMGLPGEANYALAENPEMLRQTKRALAVTGLKVHDIELARIYDDMHPTRYLPAMEVAAELGARAVLSSIWTTNRDYAAEKFAEVCDLAKPFGLTVDLEYVPIAGVKTLAGAVDVLRTVRRSNAGLMIDTHHFHRAHDKVEDLDGLPAEWFHFAHLCDAPSAMPADPEEMIRILREGRLYVGEGGIDIAGILNRLPEMVYSIELPNLARVREMGYAEHAFRCLETAKSYAAKKFKRTSETAYRLKN